MRTSNSCWQLSFTGPLAMLLALLTAPDAFGQDWARKMFEVTDHDFGVVARGSDTVYRFELKNIYKEDIELGSVRSSCGCTSPSIEGKVIKTYEKGYVVAKFNTRTFTGVHSATLTLKILKPYPAQVQLRVHGNIRGDVVFEPGSVDFESIDQGATSEKTLSVTYAGRSGWSIEDVRSASDNLEAELIERGRSGRRVNYDLVVRLRDSAPPGYLKEQLVLITNDSRNPRIPIDVVGKVTPELTVTPETLALGEVPQGEVITKRLLVRGKKPFRITELSCEDGCFEFDFKDEESAKHMITVKFTAKCDPGRLRAPIKISTDLGKTYSAQCLAYAQIAAPENEPVASGSASDSDVAQTAQAR